MLADAIKNGFLHVDMPLTHMKQLSVAEHLDASPHLCSLAVNLSASSVLSLTISS